MLMINPPIPLRFDGIVKYAREHDWHLTLANRLVRAPRGWNGDGALVTLRGDAETSRFVEGLVKAHIPVVDLTSYMPEVNVPRVMSWNTPSTKSDALLTLALKWQWEDAKL